jgi:hypothetical protein
VQGSPPAVGETVLAPGDEPRLFVFSHVEGVRPDGQIEVRLRGNERDVFRLDELRRDTIVAGTAVEVRNSWDEVRGGEIVERRGEEVVVRHGEALRVEYLTSIRVRELE